MSEIRIVVARLDRRRVGDSLVLCFVEHSGGLRLWRLRTGGGWARRGRRPIPTLCRFGKFGADLDRKFGSGPIAVRFAHMGDPLDGRQKLVEPGVLDLLFVDRKIVW